MRPDALSVASSIGLSRKYRDLCFQTVGRVAAWATARSRTEKEAVDRARRKLHQIAAAYLDRWDCDEADRLLDALPLGASAERLKPVCREILAGHASTRERLDALDSLYPDFRNWGRVLTFFGSFWPWELRKP